MYKFAVIGAGNLGRRHLQSLVETFRNSEFHVVDPSGVSLELAKEAVVSILGPGSSTNIHFASGLDQLPQALDLVVVATSANVRLEVLQKLVQNSEVRNLILEKVLFQCRQEYAEAKKILETYGAPAWVNCARREWGFYRQVKDFFANESIYSLEVVGGEWGLGCNGIHFVDLLDFLSPMEHPTLKIELCEISEIFCKREGFKEFSGVMGGFLGTSLLTLHSIRNSTKRPLISIHSEGNKSIFIDEGSKTAWKVNEDGGASLNFDTPYQSQLTGPVADQILRKNQCMLTPFADSVRLHLPFISALNGELNLERCPIT